MAGGHDLRALIRALEAQREALGDATVDFAIAALRDKAAVAEPTFDLAATPSPGTGAAWPPARVAAAAGESPEPKSPPEQKLRQVTILFCDIVDSTSIIEALSAENSLHVVNAALAAFSDAIREYGGK